MVSRWFSKKLESAPNPVDTQLTKLEKIGEGTYGVVWKCRRNDKKDDEIYALKVSRSPPRSPSGVAEGLTLATCREVALLKELEHENVVQVLEIYLDPVNKDVSLLMNYAEYDLLGMVTYHRPKGPPMPESLLMSVLWQMLQGIHYLHSNWVLHRDLKPANVLVMGEGSSDVGRVKIADLGMARLFNAPLKPLTDVDPIVVTFWYRAPELLLQAKHYTRAVDIWAIGCIMAELMMGRPLFYSGKPETKAKTSYNKDQLEVIFEVIGYPVPVRVKNKVQGKHQTQWVNMEDLPMFSQFKEDLPERSFKTARKGGGAGLHEFMKSEFMKSSGGLRFDEQGTSDASKMKLLEAFLRLDPLSRPSAKEACGQLYFHTLRESKALQDNCFHGLGPNIPKYPVRRPLKEKGAAASGKRAADEFSVNPEPSSRPRKE